MNLAFYRRLARDGVKGAAQLAKALGGSPDQSREVDGKWGEGGAGSSASSGHAERAVVHESEAREHEKGGRLGAARNSFMRAASAHLAAGNMHSAAVNRNEADRVESHFNMAQATQRMWERTAAGEVEGGVLR
jgi:hypothetical protein